MGTVSVRGGEEKQKSDHTRPYHPDSFSDCHFWFVFQIYLYTGGTRDSGT